MSLSERRGSFWYCVRTAGPTLRDLDASPNRRVSNFSPVEDLQHGHARADDLNLVTDGNTVGHVGAWPEAKVGRGGVPGHEETGRPREAFYPHIPLLSCRKEEKKEKEKLLSCAWRVVTHIL